MVNNLKRAMSIDFFGMPGSGKTTIAHQVVAELKNRGYSVNDYPIYIGNSASSMVRMLTKLKATVVFSIFHFSFIFNFFRDLEKNQFNSITEACKQWVNICYIIMEYKKISAKYDFIIFDQGIAQAAISLTVNSKKQEAAYILKKLLKEVKTIPHFIFIDVDTDTALNRQNNRKNGKSRVETQARDEIIKKQMLKGIDASCNDIVAYAKKQLLHYSNYSGQKPEEISNQIVKKLEKLEDLDNINS